MCEREWCESALCECALTGGVVFVGEGGARCALETGWGGLGDGCGRDWRDGGRGTTVPARYFDFGTRRGPALNRAFWGIRTGTNEYYATTTPYK